MWPDPDQPRSGFRSRYGGCWIDRLDGEQLVDDKLAAGSIDARDAERFRHWRRNGFLQLDGAVPDKDCERARHQLDAAFTGHDARIHYEHWRDHTMLVEPVSDEHRQTRGKLLDMHAFSRDVRRVIFSTPVVRFLSLLFDAPPMAFQSLYFRWGTNQPMHQDSAYVVVDPPTEFVGLWLALEDVVEGSGELEYYVGSHTLPDYVWDGQFKNMPLGHPDHDTYLQWLHDESSRHHLERRRFVPRRGDVLIWHADLAHGGSPVRRPDHSRRSLVAHLCPTGRRPVYFRDHPHSVPIEDPGGGFYAYVCRWNPSDPHEVAAED